MNKGLLLVLVGFEGRSLRRKRRLWNEDVLMLHKDTLFHAQAEEFFFAYLLHFEAEVDHVVELFDLLVDLPLVLLFAFEVALLLLLVFVYRLYGFDGVQLVVFLYLKHFLRVALELGSLHLLRHLVLFDDLLHLFLQQLVLPLLLPLLHLLRLLLRLAQSLLHYQRLHLLLRLQLLVQVLYVVHEVQKDLLLAEERLALVHRASHCRLPCWLSLQHLFDSEDLICTDQDYLEVPQRIVFVHKIQVVHVHRSSEFFVQVVENMRHHGRVLYLASNMNGLFAHFKLTLLHKINSVNWLTLTENYLLSLES